MWGGVPRPVSETCPHRTSSSSITTMPGHANSCVTCVPQAPSLFVSTLPQAVPPCRSNIARRLAVVRVMIASASASAAGASAAVPSHVKIEL